MTRIHPDVKEAIQEIDAAFFSGDDFHGPADLDYIQLYLDRWNLEAEFIRKMQQETEDWC